MRVQEIRVGNAHAAELAAKDAKGQVGVARNRGEQKVALEFDGSDAEHVAMLDRARGGASMRRGLPRSPVVLLIAIVPACARHGSCWR